jgi:hypothetical protein
MTDGVAAGTLFAFLSIVWLYGQSASRPIVNYGYAFAASIVQFINHVAADIASAAGYKDWGSRRTWCIANPLERIAQGFVTIKLSRESRISTIVSIAFDQTIECSGGCSQSTSAGPSHWATKCMRPSSSQIPVGPDAPSADERRAGCPVGRAEGPDDKQDHDGHAADFCAGTKRQFHIGAHGDTWIERHWGTAGRTRCAPGENSKEWRSR